MDIIIRPYRNFVSYYIYDIVIFSKIFEEHIKYLDTIFELFNRIGITFKNSKFYLGYFLIILLK
jgi:hypothetical protein